MPTLTLGEGPNAKEVEVSDEFTTLTPEMQQSTANDIAKQLGINQKPSSIQEQNTATERWQTGSLAPVAIKEKANKETGKWEATDEWRWDVPQFITSLIDSVKLPGEVMRGEVDPMSEEGFDRTMELAMNAVGGRALAGKKPKIAGEVVAETEEVVKGVKAAAPIVEKKKQTPKQLAQMEKAKATATITDQELSKIFSETGSLEDLPLEKRIAGLPFEKQKEFRNRQAERIHAAAVAGDKAGFMKEIEQSRRLQGEFEDLSPEAKSVIENSLNAVGHMDDPLKVDHFVKGLSKKLSPPTTGDKVFEVWMNALLSGPQTHVVNTLSNALVNIFGLGEAGVAAALSKATQSGISFKETGHRMLGNVEAIGDAFRAAGVSFRTERDLFEGFGQLEARKQLRAIPGPIGRAIRIPGRALTAADSFFKTLAYRQEIDGLAVRNSLDEGLGGKMLAQRIAELKANPTDDMIKSAEQFAKKQTFSNGLGTFGKSFQNLLRHNTPLKFIVPFFRTPVNLLKYSLERTPAGLAMKEVRDDIFGRNGPVKRDQALAKMIMGSAVGAYTFYQAGLGNVNGYGPSDTNARKVWLADGNQPYSVRVKDEWYAFSRLEPLGSILGMAGDLQTLNAEATEKEIADITGLISTSVARNLTNKTWLRGPIEFAEAMSNPDRYGESYIQRMLGTVVPSALGQYSRVDDPLLREAEGILDGIKERIPGFRETLNVRRDVFGEPLKGEGGLGPDFITPIYQREAKNDPTIAEMLRLETFPGRLQKSISGVDLNPEEWDFYSKVSGQSVKKFADMIVQAPVYKDLKPFEQKIMLADGIRKARNIARTATKVQFPDIITRVAMAKHLKKFGSGSIPDVQPQEAMPIPVP